MSKINIADNYSKDLYDKTKKYQKQYGFEIGIGKHDTHNNQADAFKHAFGAAETTLSANLILSKILWDAHEYDGTHFHGQPSYEENMDKWNNLEGRKIAEEIRKDYSKESIKILIKTGQMDDIIAERVMQKMRKGELITNPFTDKRKYTENSFADKIFNLKNRVFHKNELSMKDLDNPIIKDVFLDQILDNKALPTKDELNTRVANGDLIYVEGYTRSDGTKVSGYYRSYPSRLMP